MGFYMGSAVQRHPL
jgi:chromosomal replication initiation ATPase DnaA